MPTKPATNEEQVLVQQVFSFWQAHLGTERKTLTKERADKIVARLRSGFTVEELQRAILVVQNLPFWRGQNNRNRPYDDIVNIFRNDTRVQNFLETGNARTTSSLASRSDEDSFGF